MSFFKWHHAAVARAASYVVGKVADVSDSTCKYCWQNYQGECRAYSYPHSENERVARMWRGYGKQIMCRSEGNEPVMGFDYETR